MYVKISLIVKHYILKTIPQIHHQEHDFKYTRCLSCKTKTFLKKLLPPNFKLKSKNQQFRIIYFIYHTINNNNPLSCNPNRNQILKKYKTRHTQK